MNKSADLNQLGEMLSGMAAEKLASYRMLSLDSISPDETQPRSGIDQERLHELTNSILERGVRQPISVRPADEDGHYIIISGERRFRAARAAGLTEIAALIQDDATAGDQLVENIQREDLQATDIAASIERLLAEGGYSVASLCRAIGKGRDWISKYRQFGKADAQTMLLFTRALVTDVRTIVEIDRAREKEPEHVSAVVDLLLDQDAHVTRSHVLALLRAEASEVLGATDEPTETSDEGIAANNDGGQVGGGADEVEDGGEQEALDDTASSVEDSSTATDGELVAQPMPPANAEPMHHAKSVTIHVRYYPDESEGLDDTMVCELLLEAQDDPAQFAIRDPVGTIRRVWAANIEIVSMVDPEQ